jgi:hypothetical protein
MVPVEFWAYAIKLIKDDYPNTVFIAEVYNPDKYNSYLGQGGFDYLYDKAGLYDCLRDIICCDRPAHDITMCWKNLSGIDPKMLRFIENHDEQRIASGFFAGNANYALPAMFVSATLNTGPVMVYFGQEVGEPATGKTGYSGNDGRTTIFDFYNVPEHQKWMNGGKFDAGRLSVGQKQLRSSYAKLLNFSISSNAVSNGKFYDLMWANHFDGGPDTRYVYAYLRYFNDERLLMVVNFNKTAGQRFKLKIPEHAFNKMGFLHDSVIKLKDVFLGVVVEDTTLFEAVDSGIEFNMGPLMFCACLLGS